VPCGHIRLDRVHWRGSTNPIDFAKRRLGQGAEAITTQASYMSKENG
jgi:hypothetical protein